MQPTESGIRVELIMPGLVPGIHVLAALKQGMDGRDEPGHDDEMQIALTTHSALMLAALTIGHHLSISAV